MGVLSKISGPVIQAEEMRGSQINELVKVGDMELTGEIIALKNDRASIQVYEETSGLRPGEKVAGTGSALSVELGPGLLGGVFDGIQRPLNKIKEKSGDFIARGISVPSLDRKKEWDFRPTAKKGDTVEAGDVLGEVKEYDITHRILVPLGVKGKITEIKKGKLTVVEDVAVIGGKKVQMMQRWPVRSPRPYKDKKHFEPPLVTGKRIVDSFFPIAKGGTAAIPGPFGSGKCVSGDTPVLLADGRLTPIKELFETAKLNGNAIEANEFEEIYPINERLSVVSFNGKDFVPTHPACVYRGKTSRMIKVKTRSGKSVEITPIHKLFALDGTGIIEKQAQELKTGEFIVTPRKLSLSQEDAAINTIESLWDLNLLSTDEEANAAFRSALASELKRGLMERKYANYLRKERLPPLRIMHKIAQANQTSFNVRSIKPKHGKAIPVPATMTPEFAEFLGLVIADGNLHRSTYSIRFYNSESELLERFGQLAETLFGLTPKLTPHPKSPSSFVSQIDSKALFSLLNELGVPYLQKARHARVPPLLMRSSDDAALAFVSAYIACDGSVDQKGSRTEICSASRNILEDLSYLLLRRGIISRLERTRKDGTSRLWISGRGNLLQLYESTSIPGRKREALRHAIKATEWTATNAIPVPPELKESIREFTASSSRSDSFLLAAYLKEEARIGTATILKVASRTGCVNAQVMELVQKTPAVFFDEITEITIIDGNTDVYDLEVPSMHNFVGGHGALLLHNTVTQTDLAKYADADIVIYIGCGERGNELTEVLQEFPKLKDPRTGLPLMNRTVMIANTSNMPVAAREASIYTGITIAEYYRDMGYDVALMADSTSRWAEAMREISGRMEEMPGEEGYPAYLGKKLAEFYERSGRVNCLGSDKKDGSISVIGAVSPPGGDLSEPVSQATLRVTKVFWALDANLARRRHYPAINWLRSYSLYLNELKEWYGKNVAEDFLDLRGRAMVLLQKEAELQNIVQLIGPDALPDKERLVLEATKMIREDFLQQNSYDDADAFTPPKKQYEMLKTIMHFYYKAQDALSLDVPLSKILEAKEIDEIAKMKRVAPEETAKKAKAIREGIDRHMAK